MTALQFLSTYQSPETPEWTESDIPSEWRKEAPEGAVLKEFTREESDAVELDRR